ncbi:SpoIVB peptidase [Alicyclobacillus hesperidum]|uniref:SpoIVB peptidase n=1 Tax=Alicyclobacillus hesperidum TaxID=89784 RepID=UPI0002F8FFF4|nr:SpoIVB peptidase [Alicyclobacillus hesperidum]
MAGWLRALKFASLIAVTLACFAPPVRHLETLPTNIDMTTDDDILVPRTSGFRIIHSPEQTRSDFSHPTFVDLSSQQPGEVDIQNRVFGLIPWHTHVHVEQAERVIVGGQAVGIRLSSMGPIVVGFHRTSDGSSPAANAHVEIGDMILSVDKHPVRTATELQQAIRDKRGSIVLTIQRGQRKRDVVVPCPATANGSQLGIYVRDKTVGVGTLTFYNPQTGAFAALGHMISDVDTGRPIVGQGAMYPAVITGVQAGKIGEPGEKKGMFVHSSRELGHIAENTPYGIFGKLDVAACHATGGLREPIPVALPTQVHPGPAVIYTVLHGQKVEPFQVRIENTSRQRTPSTKSLILRVTDPRLLSTAGGIVQGMSGSPIVQDGKLVGAVTHVFVSDPTRGYGVYAYWMLHHTGHDEEPASTALTSGPAKAV